MRKLTILAVFIVLLSGSTAAFAGFIIAGSGGAISVQEAKDLPDDKWVTLEGNIVKPTTDGHYIFQDDTGEIEVEIDNEVWMGQEVSADTKIRVTGEVDRDTNSVTIDVIRIEII